MCHITVNFSFNCLKLCHIFTHITSHKESIFSTLQFLIFKYISFIILMVFLLQSCISQFIFTFNAFLTWFGCPFFITQLYESIFHYFLIHFLNNLDALLLHSCTNQFLITFNTFLTFSCVLHCYSFPFPFGSFATEFVSDFLPCTGVLPEFSLHVGRVSTASWQRRYTDARRRTENLSKKFIPCVLKAFTLK